MKLQQTGSHLKVAADFLPGRSYPGKIHSCICSLKPASLHSFSSEQTFGAWYYTLNAGRDVLPQAKEAEVLQMVRGVTDVKERQRIYDHFQSTTRYVSDSLA